MRNTEGAFHWIVDILEAKKIPYKISGGLAAHIYGVDRELADIDIEVNDEDILKIVDDVRPYITFGPDRYLDDHWDLNLMTLMYEGQEIDIAGAQAKIFDSGTRQWIETATDVDSFELQEVFGRMVRVETKESLIAYKTTLSRAVDIEDVRQLNA